MASIWGDGWFYISALGFLGSGALFLYLLGHYRSAVEEAEDSDTASPLDLTSDGPLSAKPFVVELTPTPVASPVASQPKARTAALSSAIPSGIGEPSPSPTTANVFPDARQGGVASATPRDASGPGYTGPERRRSDIPGSGGISPAVVYLQNIQSQLERFDKEIAALKGLSAQQAVQGELVLKRLSELAEGLKTGASPRSALPAPARSVELPLETAPEEVPASEPVKPRPAQAAEPKPSAVLSGERKAPPAETPDRPESAPPASALSVPAREAEAKVDPAATVVIEALPQVIATPEPAAPAPAAEPVVQPSQPRKGPVWPV